MGTFKKWLITLLLGGMCGMILPVEAQQQAELSIQSFDVDIFDIAGQRSERTDANGDKYAIVKVTSTLPNDRLNEYHFNFGQMNCIVEEHDEALWLYVQRNAKHVTVSREGYKRVYRYDLKRTLQAAKTYVMVLQPAVPEHSKQVILFDMHPKDARAVVLVTPEGESEDYFGIQDENGVVAKSMPYGTYTYRVTAEQYQTAEGKFTLNDQKKVYMERISLVPNVAKETTEDQNNVHQPVPDTLVLAQEVEEEKVVEEEDVDTALWVDLGLSVKWASRNVGAASPEQCGDYFAWGEIVSKEKYTETNSRTFQKSWGCFAGNTQYDAATAAWGNSARTPTMEEMKELIAHCDFQWIVYNQVEGCRVTSKINHKSIFLPAVGHRHRTALKQVGKQGYYWSATPYESSDDYSYGFGFEEDGPFLNWDARNYGHCIRPVCQ